MPPTCSAMHCVTCWTRACGAAAEGFVPDSRRQHQETSPMRPSSPLRRKAIATAGWLALAIAPAFAQAPAVQKPQYGGELNIGNVFATVSPMSSDPAAWAWKHSQDTGLAYEQLFSADLRKARRNGGPYNFTADAWLPSDGMR